VIVLDIARTELRRMFQLPLAWVILAAVQFLLAIFFYVLLSRYLEAPQWTHGRGLTEIVVTGTLQFGGIVMLLVSPFITMRLFSEERRSGTLDLLLSSPVSLTELVLGKFLGVLMFFGIMLVMVALMPLSLLAGTALDVGQLAAAFLGLGLLMAAFAAVGLFVSTLTDQPAVAAVASFAMLFLLWIIHIAGHSGSDRMAAVFAYLSLLRHFDGLLSGFFSSVDVVYYLLIVATFLALAIWRLDSVRTWR
jgi:ABC-2 type transport system permease protein